MADGLYTGIALSGKEKVDNSGQLALLEAEKAAAGQRLAKQKEEEKKKSDLMDYVKKNTVLSQNLKTPYYQRKLANKAYETISGIIDAIEKGEENSWAIAKNGVQQYEVFKNATESADASLFETMKTVKENPYDYAFQDKQVINGKEYNNFYEAISDPYADTEEGIQEIMSKYGGTEYIFQKNDPNSVALGMPETLVGYSPTPMADPQETAREIAKQKEMFNMPRIGKTQWIPGTDEGLVSRGYGLSNEGIVSLEEQLYNNKAVRRYYEEALYKEAKQSKPELTKAEFLKTDWLNQVPQRIHQDVGVPAQSWMDAQGFNEVSRPKEESKGSSNARFESKRVAVFDGDDVIKDLQPWGDNTDTGKNYQYLSVSDIQGKTGSIDVKIDIKPGVLYWDSEGGEQNQGILRAPQGFETNVTATPYQVVVMSDGKKKQPYIRYLPSLKKEESEADKFNWGAEGTEDGGKGKDRFKGRTYESFYVPATEAQLKRIAAKSETSLAEWNNLIIDLTKRAAKGASTQTTDAGSGETIMGEKEGKATEKTNAPKVGAIISGYRFKGGDPNKQSNWEKVQ